MDTWSILEGPRREREAAARIAEGAASAIELINPATVRTAIRPRRPARSRRPGHGAGTVGPGTLHSLQLVKISLRNAAASVVDGLDTRFPAVVCFLLPEDVGGERPAV